MKGAHTTCLHFTFSASCLVGAETDAGASVRFTVVDAPKPRPRVIFSGIQPTGIPHLGNYFGALVNWVKLQAEAGADDKLLFSVVGWHALTLPQDPRKLAAARSDMIALLLAVGIDPKRSVIFHQDHVQAHTELSWILGCLISVGRLQRMTTWKSRLAVARNANDESEIDDSVLNTGLLTYPVLQAADILAYKSTHVPVGDDQQQHIELARDIADAFNRAYSKKRRFFSLPDLMTTPSKRILSLTDPSAKMSKSAFDPKSRIELTHTAAEITTRIRGATTDSIQGITYDPVARPGTSNLLTILAACTGESAEACAARFASRDHGALKAAVTEAVEAALAQPRKEFTRLRAEQTYLADVAAEGAVKAREMADATLREVRKLTGLA
ncbi:hypothetical protein K488DRAFT_76877 [Vararia minispora EC-137]|uniref:Uncharacterized protein n=1 Tax=Vararia minispora EC-137 TaxID=1314806 RepID=A0ACB8QTZ2_9AGAM|nr:hypothetical protein K488DRAFT_76877 [Vararia minispora EC-137]